MIKYETSHDLRFWNTLIPPCPELPNDIDDYDDIEKEVDDDDDDDLSPMPVESEEADYTC